MKKYVVSILAMLTVFLAIETTNVKAITDNIERPLENVFKISDVGNVTNENKKQVLNIGISGIPSTWVYGETQTPKAEGVEELESGDYEIFYAKENENGLYEKVGTVLPKLAGKYAVTIAVKNEDYEPSEATVFFEITPITEEVKIQSSDATFEYDGTEHKNETYEVLFANDTTPVENNKLPNGDVVSAIITGAVKDVSDTEDNNNTIGTITIVDVDGTDVTNCYSNIVKSEGKLTVTPILTSLNVYASSGEKPFDGTPLTAENCTYTDGILISGDKLKATIIGNQTYVGTSKNKVENVKIYRGTKDITSNYTIKAFNSSLTVVAADQPITIEDQYFEFNRCIAINDLKKIVKGNKGEVKLFVSYVVKTSITWNSEIYQFGEKEGSVVMTAEVDAFDENGDGINEWNKTTKNFTIYVVDKIKVNISGLKNNEKFFYNGKPKKPSGIITVNETEVNISELEVNYRGTDSTTYDSAEPPTDIGTYEVTYKVPDSNKKYMGAYSVSFSIIKRKNTSRSSLFTIDVVEGKNGNITPNGIVKVENGEEQNFDIKAKEGYEIEDVLVDGKSVGPVEKYTFEKINAEHTIEAKFKKIENLTFKDINDDDWYNEAVKYVVNRGLMNGTEKDSFSPNTNTTRAMIVTILYRLEGSPIIENSTFIDVESTAYYARAVAWAKENGIVNGYEDSKFGPNDNITREQLATIMYRYTIYKKYDTEASAETNILSYNDINELSEYAVSAMQWACGEGLIKGVPVNKLSPKTTATRAQVATILMRYCEKYAK